MPRLTPKILKKKGLKMTKEVMERPYDYRMRVVVAFDAQYRTLPYLYVLNGARSHETEHQIRKTYTQTTACPYYDTRVILYDTFVKRMKKDNKPIYFGNNNPEVIVPEKKLEHNSLF